MLEYKESYRSGDVGAPLKFEGWSIDRKEKIGRKDKFEGLGILFARNLIFWSSAATSTALIFFAIKAFF